MQAKNKHIWASAIAVCAIMAGGTSFVIAKEKAPTVQSDTSGLPDGLSSTIARSAIAMGVQEPLSISRNPDGAKVTGSNAAICNIKLSTDAEPKMLGIACK